MVAVSAVLSGAGISRGFPASLPLGDEFHDALLSGCFGAASVITGGVLGEDSLRLLMANGRRNILGCIEDCLESGTVVAVLDCLRVQAPTEEHLLCALLAARGVLQLTLNFDNGIELAYHLLTRRAELPAHMPACYHEALVRWRAAMPDVPPLRVVSTPRELALRGFEHRPLLVKLRGSVDVGIDGTVVPLRPTMEDLECTLLDEDRRQALREAAGSGLLLVTGHSGRDLDVFETLEAMLRPGGFDWVAPALEDAIAARLRKVDPRQPRRATARQALRAELGELPEWPSTPISGHSFSQRFAAWWQSVPQSAGAEAYARLLSEAGHHGDAVLVLRAVAAATARPRAAARVRLRLADALARRGKPNDVAEAKALYVRVLRGRGTPPALRAYAITRWNESRVGSAPTGAMFLAAVIGGIAALLLAQAGHGRHRVSVRALAGVARVAAHFAEARLAASQSSRIVRSRTILVVWSANRLLALAGHRAVGIGTATRQSDLDLLRLRVEFVSAVLRGTPPAPDASVRLAAVERAYTHRGNRAGVIEARLTRALMLLAARDTDGFRRSMSTLGCPTIRDLRPQTTLDVDRLIVWARMLGVHPSSSGSNIVGDDTMDHP